MRDKTDQIFAAALKIFLQKGYLQATTQEIAKEAQVAELTLFRKFSTKQNLFMSVFKPIIERQFNSKIMKYAEEENTTEFFRKILEDRLETVSKNSLVVKLLITESVMNRLDKEINIPSIMFNSLKQAIEAHFSHKDQHVDSEQCAKFIGGMMLSHVFLPEETPYHLLPEPERKKIVERYMKALEAFTGE